MFFIKSSKKFVPAFPDTPRYPNACPPNVDQTCLSRLEKLKVNGNYREFVDVERHCGEFPHATWRTNGQEKKVKTNLVFFFSLSLSLSLSHTDYRGHAENFKSTQD